MLNLKRVSSGYLKAPKRSLILSITFLLLATMIVPLTNAATITFLDPPAAPTITLNPTSGPVGTTVIVNGENFKQGDTVTITFDGSPVTTVPATVTVSGNTFSCTFVVPSSTTGGKIVTATATDGDIDSAIVDDNDSNVIDDNDSAINGDTDSVTFTVNAGAYYLYLNIVGSGLVTYNGSMPYDAGDVVNLTAYASAGWEFSHWDGDLTGTANPEYLTMDSNKTVTAYFTEIPAYYDVHDVEAVSQTVADNKVLPGDWVDIDVTVRNNGNFTESFDVTCYYNGSEIDTIRVWNLTSGESRVVTFTWDTAGVPMNEYDITALADSSAEIVEVDEDNNWCTMPLKLFVIPEVPLGTILTILTMFIGLIGYLGFKRLRKK